jgi:putative Holliday junction resolvase
MRALALDLGDKRIGVAVSDADERVASPVTVLERTNDRERLHREIAALVEEWDADILVVGLPLSLDGGRGPAATKVEAEVTELADVVAVPIELHDERMSTVTAERLLKERDLDGRARRKVVDMVAASVILQDWLDRRAGAG